MLMIDNEKQELDVRGDGLTLCIEMSILNNELHKIGFDTSMFASIVCNLLFMTFNKEERIDFMKKLNFLVERKTKRK